MRGSILLQLQHYVTARHGAAAWPELLRAAHAPERTYLHSEEYPEWEALALLRCAAHLWQQPFPEFLENFGEFITPWLMKLYAPLIPGPWGTLVRLLHAPAAIHIGARSTTHGARPPRLQLRQTAPNQLRLVYDSPQGLGALAKGIIRGVANHYGYEIEVEEAEGAGGEVAMDAQIQPPD